VFQTLPGFARQGFCLDTGFGFPVAADRIKWEVSKTRYRFAALPTRRSFAE